MRAPNFAGVARSTALHPLALLVACAGLCACASPPAPRPAAPLLPPQLLQILEWEDRRSLGEGKLVDLALADPDLAVRLRAHLALARIQDASVAPARGTAL